MPTSCASGWTARSATTRARWTTASTGTRTGHGSNGPPGRHGRSAVRATGERALVLGGGGSTGNAWLIGVVAGLFDAGLDVTAADLTIGTSAGSTAAAQMAGATPTELFAASLAAAPPARPIVPDPTRVLRRPAVNHLERVSAIIDASEDAADMRRRMGAAALDLDAASDGSGATWRAIVAARLPTRTGRNGRCSSPRSMPRPATRWCSTAQRGRPGGRRRRQLFERPSLRDRGPPLHRRRLPAQRRTPIWPPGTSGCWCCRPSAAGRGSAGLGHAPRRPGRRAARTRQQGRDDLPGQQSEHLFGANAMDLSLRPAAARAGYEQASPAEQLAELWR